MWNKQRDEYAPPQPEPIRGNTPQPMAAPPPMQMPTVVRPAAPTAAIGASMQIKGEIRSCEEMLVDGDVEGSMESESSLTVGRNGKIKANIKAREVVIFGSVRGDVEVVEKIAIREQGSLIGNIKCAGISIDDGAYFKGSIDIIRSDQKVTTKPEQSSPKKAVAVS